MHVERRRPADVAGRMARLCRSACRTTWQRSTSLLPRALASPRWCWCWVGAWAPTRPTSGLLRTFPSRACLTCSCQAWQHIAREGRCMCSFATTQHPLQVSQHGHTIDVPMCCHDRYPNMVQRVLPFCGSARTSEHNKVRPAVLGHAPMHHATMTKTAMDAVAPHLVPASAQHRRLAVRAGVPRGAKGHSDRRCQVPGRLVSPR